MFTWENTYYTLVDMSYEEASGYSTYNAWKTALNAAMTTAAADIDTSVFASTTRAYVVVYYSSSSYKAYNSKLTVNEGNSGVEDATIGFYVDVNSSPSDAGVYVSGLTSDDIGCTLVDTSSNTPIVGLKIILVPAASSTYLVENTEDDYIEKHI